MNKLIDRLIDNIIELVLEDMDCHHVESLDEDGHRMSVEYNIKYETVLKERIGKLIEQWSKKPEVTEEWIEEKAKKVTALFYRLTQHEPYLENHQINLQQAKDFIRSLVEEIKK